MTALQRTHLEAELERRIALIEREHADNPLHRDLPRGDAWALVLLVVGALVVVLVSMAQ